MMRTRPGMRAPYGYDSSVLGYLSDWSCLSAFFGACFCCWRWWWRSCLYSHEEGVPLLYCYVPAAHKEGRLATCDRSSPSSSNLDASRKWNHSLQQASIQTTKLNNNSNKTKIRVNKGKQKRKPRHAAEQTSTSYNIKHAADSPVIYFRASRKYRPARITLAKTTGPTYVYKQNMSS